MTPSPRPDRAWRALLAGLFVAALGLRVGLLVELADLASFHRLVADARFFDGLARQLLAGSLGGEAEQGLLYPFFLAAVYRLAGPSYLAVRVVQAALSAATTVLVALAGERLAGRRAGAAAGLLAVAYGPFVVYSALLLKATLALFAFAAFLFALLAALGPGRARPGVAAVAGAGLALAALLRENLLLLAPLVALALALLPGAGRLRRTAAFVAAGLAVAFGSAALHAGATGAWRATSPLAGVNLYLGNSAVASGTFVPLPGSQFAPEMMASARRLAAEVAGRPAGEVAPEEVSGILWRETARQVAARPAAWLRLELRKARLFWHGGEVSDAEGVELFRELAGTLWLAPVGFGWLPPLALLGVLPAWRRSPPRAIALLLVVLGVMLSVLVFFFLTRYRLPAVLALLPLAGAGVAWWVEAAAARRWRPLVAGTVLAAALAVAIAMPAFPALERRAHVATQFYNLGAAASALASAHLDAAAAAGGAERTAAAVRGVGRAAEAEAFLGRALALAPDLAPAYVERSAVRQRRANLLVLLGRREEAAASNRQAIADAETVLTLGPGVDPVLTAAARDLRRVARRNLARFGEGRER